jgi:hypothetical protein
MLDGKAHAIRQVAPFSVRLFGPFTICPTQHIIQTARRAVRLDAAPPTYRQSVSSGLARPLVRPRRSHKKPRRASGTSSRAAFRQSSDAPSSRKGRSSGRGRSAKKPGSSETRLSDWKPSAWNPREISPAARGPGGVARHVRGPLGVRGQQEDFRGDLRSSEARVPGGP